MAQGIHVDTERWPLVISRLPARLELEALERYFVEQRAILARGQPWAHLVDTCEVCHVPGASLRSRLAALTKELVPLSATLNIATAVVIDSGLVRGALTALHWIVPPPHPLAAVATRLDGMVYLCAAYEKRKLPVPPSVGRYRDLLRSTTHRSEP